MTIRECETITWKLKWSSLTILATALFVIACDSKSVVPSEPDRGPRVTLLAGDRQTTEVDFFNPAPFVVRLEDGSGKGIQNARIDWRIFPAARDARA